jgi:hypothetical protein
MSKTIAEPIVASPSSRPDDVAATIGGLVRAAEVGVETVRYYQRRRLLAVPHSAMDVYKRSDITRQQTFTRQFVAVMRSSGRATA